MGPGGEHALMATHNRLSGLGTGEYLEVIAIDPDAPPPGRPRWFDLDRRAGPPRIGNWIVRTDDLDALIRRYPAAGRAVSFERGPYRWRMAVPENGILPFDGCFPALLQWDTPAPTFPDTGLRLTALTLSHPNGDRLKGMLDDILTDTRISVNVEKRRIAAFLDTPAGPRNLA